MSGIKGTGGAGSRLPTSRISRPNAATGMVISGSKSNTQSPEPTPVPLADTFIIGDRIWVSGVKPGTILFIGETQFADGEWAGVLLDDTSGKNDGSVQGVRYFQCPPGRGLFARLSNLRREPKPIKAPSGQPGGGNGDSSEGTPSEVGSLVSPPTSTADGVGPHGDAASPTAPANSNNNNNGAGVPASPSVPSAAAVLSVPAVGDLRVGDRVMVLSGNRTGTLRYLGGTEFAKGHWAGVELDDPSGKNDGSVAGRRYFACKPNYGLFAPPHKVVKAGSAAASSRHSSTSTAGAHGRKSAMPPGSSKLPGGMRSRSGSQESISSVGSNFSSASRTRVKLGVTALSSNQRSNNNTTGVATSGTSQRRSSTSNVSTAGKAVSVTALQKVLREKEEHIEQLLRERDLERSEVARAAAQADELEARRVLVEQERERIRAEAAAGIQGMEARLAESERQRHELQLKYEDERRKVEELQFEMEEENIDKSTLETKTEQDESKIFELEESLANERERACSTEEKLKQIKELYELEKTKAKEAEESAVMYLEQVESLQARLSTSDQMQARDRTESDTIRTQLDEKEARLKELSERLEQSERQVKELQRTVESATDEKASLAKRKVKQDAQVTDLMSRLEVAESQRQASAEEARAASARTLELEGEVAAALARLESVSSANEGIKAELAAASDARAGDDAAKAETGRLREQLREREEAFASAEEARSRSELRVRQLEAQLKEESSRRDEEINSQAKKFELQMRTLQEKIEELSKKASADAASAESRYAHALESHKEELEAERAAAANRHEQLARQLAEREAAIAAAHASADQAREQLEESAGQLEEVKRDKSRLELSLRTAEADRAELIQAKRAAVDDRERLATNILSAEEEMSAARARVEELGKERDAAVEEKNKALMASTEMKAKSMEVQMRVDCLTKEKSDLETRVTALHEELNAKSADADSAARERISGLESELTIERQAVAELRQYNGKLESERNSLVTEISKLKNIMDEKSRLQKERDELQGQLKDMRHKCSHFESLNVKNQEQLGEMSNELRKSRDQLIALTRDHEALKTKHRQSLETKEKDRRRLEEKVRGLEHKIKEDSRDDMSRRLQDAKENAEQQIDFLNSVIVDLKTKNTDLMNQVKLLSETCDRNNANGNGNGNDESFHKPPSQLLPRPYCDICEQFDVHDTEDCPSQMSSSINSRFHGDRNATRPYCEACEMFDHWTHECDDQVTF